MSEESEILVLLRENNKMLKEIVSYVRAVSNKEHIDNENAREFAYNVIADILVESMSQESKDDILRNTL